jgi:hypothetical protein
MELIPTQALIRAWNIDEFAVVKPKELKSLKANHKCKTTHK